MSELFKRLRRALQGPADKIPEGWRTVAQWAELWGISGVQARDYLKAGERDGIVEACKLRVDTGDYLRPVIHFREVKQCPKKPTESPKQRKSK